MVLNPRVQIQINDAITLTQPGGPAVIALMGTAQWGPTDSLQTFSSFSQLLDTYKEDKSGLFLIKGADLAYNNGAFVTKVVRVVDGTEANATLNFVGAGPTASVVTINAKYSGTYGNNIIVDIITQGTGRIAEVTDGQIIERFTNSGATNGYATNALLAAALNAGSSLVTATANNVALITAVSDQALVGGLDGNSSLITSDYTTAFDNYFSNETWDIMVVPGTNTLEATDAFQTTMLGKVNTRASSEKKYGMYFSGVITDETIATFASRTAAGDRLVLTAPAIKYTPRFTGTQSVFNGTLLACALAGNVAAADVEISPTRKVLTIEGLSVDTTSGKEFYNAGEIESVLEQRIIPVSKIEGALKVARGVTRITDVNDIDFEINIVRIKDFLRSQVQTTLDPFLGQPNLERIRSVMATACDGILASAQLDEIIVAFQPTEVAIGISPDTVLVNMTVQPTFAINFINVTITVSRL